MPAVVEFPPVVIELEAEMQCHPKLIYNLLQLPKDPGIELKIAEVAAYCDVVLDGTYDNDDLLKLFDILLKKLQAKRANIILPN